MKYLSIDTTSNFTKLSFLDTTTKVKNSICENTENTQASSLISLIDDLMIKAKVSISQLDCIVVNTGPGSYTSLRIGISTAKGLALPFNTPIIAVNSFELYEYLYVNNKTENYAILIENTKKQAYLKAGPKTKIISLEQISEELPINCKIYGNGIIAYKTFLSNFNIKEDSSLINPSDLIDFVLNTSHNNKDLSPLYIKPLSYKKQIQK